MTIAASIEKSVGYCNGLASVRLSVCPVGILTVAHQGAACDAASVHFGPITKRTDIGLLLYFFWL